MKNKVIIHFQPLELYPPVQNLLNTLSGQLNPDKKIFVITTSSSVFKGQSYISPSKNLIIARLAKTGINLSPLSRYINYVSFFTRCLIMLVLKRPSIILYYETLSSFPAYLYKRYIRPKTAIMIHYHEYTSPEEYQSGMRLITYFHTCEKWLYSRSSWISHTNNFRMQQFIADISPIQVDQTHILPNYPPVKWMKKSKTIIEFPVKFVYAGALSLDNMFSREFANWVMAQKGKVIWDIFSLNITEEAKKYIESLSSEWIHICGEVSYESLPAILINYDVGIVLYNGHIPNYVYNAPNKLFEYHACGLDVWFPEVMKGSLAYATQKTYPKILAVDFKNLDTINLNEMINRNALVNQCGKYFCEDALGPVCSRLLI